MLQNCIIENKTDLLLMESKPNKDSCHPQLGLSSGDHNLLLNVQNFSKRPRIYAHPSAFMRDYIPEIMTNSEFHS
jgi:hypothetical protein